MSNSIYRLEIEISEILNYFLILSSLIKFVFIKLSVCF